MLDVRQFRDLVIIPAIETLQLHSQAAVELLLGTALQESGLRYLKQVGGGPAMGFFQMEPATHDDIWTNFLEYKPALLQAIRSLSRHRIALAMASDLWYAAAMCRIHYLRVSAPLPAAGDFPAQAAYWKAHYNTPQGAGKESEYLANWNKYGIQ